MEQREHQIGVVAGDDARGSPCDSALKTVSTTVIGKVIHQRIGAGRTALTTVPCGTITLSGRKLPSLTG